ncbi:ABC-F type ribosomal protection protein [Clostridium sp. SHJSY1]|uniref:ABC-F type ribosomal protection protein CplR n=1 Tax=Clostridium sp. SHJSY1 TaxID=2942483 RepID=UPI002877055D|nr:ABC-F type ribosomal protection protein CplR [Clostridium sp. SHJSY1]MDS0525273.1 ABC-F type ribosomal protection protein [Clostridium sp. SHJSY1]
MLLVSVNKLKKYYSDRLILDIDKFEISDNQRVGLVGGNGAGKTTFLKALIGETDIEEGNIFLTDSYTYISQSEDTEYFCEESKAKSILNAPDKFQEYLSGGEKVKLKIANALKEKKELIIADEPTSNLDQHSIEVLEEMLKQHNGAILLVSHDRRFLDDLCDTIVEIEDGKMKVYKGNYETYLKLKEEAKERQKFEYDQYISEKRRLQLAKNQQTSLRDGMRKAPKRMGNSEARLHKLGNQKGEKKVDNSAKAIQTRIDKLEVKEKPKNISEIKIYIQDYMEVESKNLIEVNNLNLSIEENILLDNASFKVKRNKKIALLGENGSGKTTLIKEILKADNRAIRINPKVKVGYFAQNQDTLDSEKSILDNIKNTSSFDETFIRINLNLFGFSGEDVYKKVEVLSGGEKVKVSLCKIILEDNNLLILDEPTNYLDITSIKALESALLSTDKTMIIVSHDRVFIEKIYDYILEIKNKDVETFSGNYSEFQEEKNKVKTNKEEQKVNDEIFVLENKLSNIISMLCVETNLDKKQEYDNEYNSILAKLKELRFIIK